MNYFWKEDTRSGCNSNLLFLFTPKDDTSSENKLRAQPPEIEIG